MQVSKELKKHKQQESIFKHRLHIQKPDSQTQKSEMTTRSILEWEHREKAKCWSRRVSPGFTFPNLVLPDPDFEGDIRSLETRVSSLESEIDCVKEDLGVLQHDLVTRRCRPYPYDVTQTLNLADGGAPNTFGAYTQLMPVGTYNFGDSPNRVQVTRLMLELMSANDTYIIEFTTSPDGVTFTVRGAVRFRRGAAIARTFPIDAPCRPFNIDNNTLYGRLKSALGGANVTFALCMARFIPTESKIQPSAGIWPLG